MDLDGDGDDQEEDDLPPVRLTLANIRSLTTLLQSIKISAKQVCTVVLAPEGIELHWADDSKTLRSSVQLCSELFSSYECGPTKRVFGVQFLQLIDTLGVFAASASSAPLLLVYPGSYGELKLEMEDTGDNLSAAGDNHYVLYARITTMEQDLPSDMTDYWREPASFFLIKGGLLKEAVDDLEWPGGAVTIKLTRDPAAICMSAAGTGSLQVHFNATELSGFQVSQPTVVHRYKYKNLKAAMSHIPDGKGLAGTISTKVSIDANGLLKVTHMVPLGGSGHGHGGGSAFAVQQSALSSFAATQAALDSARVGVIQFVSSPVEDED